jgi:hypothetical protein
VNVSPILQRRATAAKAYAQRGWPVFLLGRDKTPLPNCPECARADWSHDREACECLFCHGFYAATTSESRLRIMLTQGPRDGMLALRTGGVAGIVALDFEAKSDQPGSWPTGLEVFDAFESYTQGVKLPPTLTQRTGSGGLHVLYVITNDGWRGAIKSRNRVLPSVDVKSDGGYIAVETPGGDGRRWVDFTARIAPLPDDLAGWLASRRGPAAGGGGGAGGGDGLEQEEFRRAVAEGPRGGTRDAFFNQLLFKLRKEGKSRDYARVYAHEIWLRAEQPPACEWHMPFEHVEYKIERVWQTVEPDRLPEWQKQWASQYEDGVRPRPAGPARPITVRKVNR